MEDTKFIPEIEVSIGEDRWGRNIKLSIKRGNNSYVFPNLHVDELESIADCINAWLNSI